VTYQPFINSSSELAVALLAYSSYMFSPVNCRKNVIRLNSTQWSEFILSMKMYTLVFCHHLLHTRHWFEDHV